MPFERPIVSDWRPEMPPALQPGEPIGFDYEYRPHDNPLKIEPIGYSIYVPRLDRGWYVPFAHEGGGNLDKATAVRWLTKELPRRLVVGLSTKFEIHCTRNLNVEIFDEVSWHDVAFSATLLDELRYDGFSLESLAIEWLPESERKVHPSTIHPEFFYKSHSSEVQERAVSDSRLAWLIHAATWPRIQAENLVNVLALENKTMLAVVEMERNGALIDRPKLERWIAELNEMLSRRTLAFGEKHGVGAFNPNKAEDLMRLFTKLGMEKPVAYDEDLRSYQPSWSVEALANVAYKNQRRSDGIINEDVAEVVHLRKLMSLRSKYLRKYIAAIDETNTFHFPLHQLRSESDKDSPSYGTVTGRFSCGGGKHKLNVQQAYKGEKQVEAMGDEFIIRELYIPEPGMVLGASDASQIEFRLFGHYSGAELITEAYRNNPMEDFHMLVTIMMNPSITDKAKLKALRAFMKNNNFGVLYGMGRLKLARKLGYPCTCPFDWYEKKWDERRQREVNVRGFWNNNDHLKECRARIANDIMDEYKAKFPHAEKLLKKAGQVAEERGYVFTLFGRRRHYPQGPYYSALNSIIQGSAADVFKQKTVELYESRKTLEILMRMPVHDEHVYDVSPSFEAQCKVHELLDAQSFLLSVPLLWESGFGSNWRQANEDKAFMKAYHARQKGMAA